MAKIRVHELSKELGKENKEILAFLNERGIEVTSHMSVVEDDVADKVRSKFSTAEKAEKPVKPSSDNVQAEDSKAEAPKKKNIIRVVRPQNSQQGLPSDIQKKQRDRNRQNNRSNQQGRPEGDNRQRRPEGNTDNRRDQRNDRRPDNRQNKMENRPIRRREVTHSVEVEDVKSARERIERSKQSAQQKQVEIRAQQKEAEEAAALAALEAKREAEAREKAEAQKAAEEQKAAEARRLAEAQKAAEETKMAEAQKKSEKAVSAKTDRPGRTSQGEGRQNGHNNQGGKDGSFRKDDGQRKDRRDNDRRDNDRRPADRNSDRSGGRNMGNASDVPAKNDNRRNDGKSGKDFRKNDRQNNDNQSRQSVKDASQKRKGHKDIKNYDSEQFEQRKSGGKKAGAFNKPQKVEKPKEKEEQIKMITVPATITIQELADKMKIQPSAIVKKLFMQGTIVTINQEVEYETAEEIAMEFDVLCEPEKIVDLVEEMLVEEAEDEKNLKKRPPVVCVMGHVDHGKTSLLDAIRNTHVIDKEAGGITQHIGAYVVNINGESITFLDTPGHEAFTAMRMRGASSTDIAILVVAADDGVMPQTVEAINHAKAAGVEIIVAVNKIDKPGANIDRVKQELTEYELIPEDWGGTTVVVPVSAKTHEGIDNLLEMIILTAEVMELKANAGRTARGLVLEAQLDKGKGPVATVLVQKGTLHVGDPVAAGVAFGKVRAMMDDKGRRVKEAGPSTPVEILGLNDVPGAGDVFIAPETDKEARSFAETYINQNKVHMLSENKSRVKMSLDDLYAQIQEGNLKELGIIVKADVQGSVEAVRQSLEKLSNDEVIVKVIHGGVGAINESDVMLASASNAIIIGFNVRPDAQAKDNAEQEGVDIRLYRVIYNAIEDIEAAMKGMLEPEYVEQVIGHADVRQTFKASGVGTIAGAYVTDGRFERNASVRLVRDSIVVYEGSLASLRRFKDDVKEVKSGYECGLVFENYNDIKEGDKVEAFVMVEVPR